MNLVPESYIRKQEIIFISQSNKKYIQLSSKSISKHFLLSINITSKLILIYLVNKFRNLI